MHKIHFGRFDNISMGLNVAGEKGRENVYLNPVVKDGSITFTIEKKGTPQKGTVSRGKGRCLQCGHTVVNKYIQKEIFAHHINGHEDTAILRRINESTFSTKTFLR